ncbi:unnamed protein product, partial [Symbiodinium sp. CCMP2456]
MECLAAACKWLCQPAPAPARPGARSEASDVADEEVDELEFGPFQMATCADAPGSSPSPEDQEDGDPGGKPALPDGLQAAKSLHKDDEEGPQSPGTTVQETDLDSQETDMDFEEHSDFVQKICSTPTEQKPSLPDVPYTEKSDNAEEGPKSPASTADDTGDEAIETKITLNIYDVSQAESVQWVNAFFANQYAPVQLFGAFHVGVQVGDEEWAFGATPAGSGVCRHKPRGAEQHHFRQSLA